MVPREAVLDRVRAAKAGHEATRIAEPQDESPECVRHYRLPLDSFVEGNGVPRLLSHLDDRLEPLLLLQLRRRAGLIFQVHELVVPEARIERARWARHAASLTVKQIHPLRLPFTGLPSHRRSRGSP